ncbi:hypothetical protein GGR09_000746 [Bartonella heixiaziensis]
MFISFLIKFGISYKVYDYSKTIEDICLMAKKEKKSTINKKY